CSELGKMQGEGLLGPPAVAGVRQGKDSRRDRAHAPSWPTPWPTMPPRRLPAGVARCTPWFIRHLSPPYVFLEGMAMHHAALTAGSASYSIRGTAEIGAPVRLDHWLSLGPSDRAAAQGRRCARRQQPCRGDPARA